MNDSNEIMDLSFSRDEELSPEKLSAFERALEHSYILYKQGLELHAKIIGNTSNKHIKMSLANANSTAGAVLDMIESHGDIVVLDKKHARSILMPFVLAASELLNTEP